MVKKKIPRILHMSLSGILTVVLLLASLPFSFYSTAAEIKDLSVQKANDYFNWKDTSNMQGYDETGNKIEGGLKTYGTTTITDTEYTSEVERYSSSYVDYTGKTTTPSFWTSGVVFTMFILLTNLHIC